MTTLMLDAEVMPGISASDYCDRCQTRAVGVALINGYPLYFCLHHLREFLPVLEEKGYPYYTELDIDKDVFFRTKK